LGTLNHCRDVETVVIQGCSVRTQCLDDRNFRRPPGGLAPACKSTSATPCSPKRGNDLDFAERDNVKSMSCNALRRKSLACREPQISIIHPAVERDLKEEEDYDAVTGRDRYHAQYNFARSACSRPSSTSPQNLLRCEERRCDSFHNRKMAMEECVVDERLMEKDEEIGGWTRATLFSSATKSEAGDLGIGAWFLRRPSSLHSSTGHMCRATRINTSQAELFCTGIPMESHFRYTQHHRQR
jgi:hypothetical protein